MRKAMMIMSFVLLSGCGSLRINPKSCKTDAVWGSDPLSSREITREELEEESVVDLKVQGPFYVFGDEDLRLRDLLEEHGLTCEGVKKLRVRISTKWFFIREVSLKVVKK